MKLFFETTAQGTVFLLMLPLGMLLAVCIDLCTYSGRFRPIWDLATMLLISCIVGLSIVLLNDATLRIYHLLAILMGYLLYACGLRRLFHCLTHLMEERKKARIQRRKKRAEVE